MSIRGVSLDCDTPGCWAYCQLTGPTVEAVIRFAVERYDWSVRDGCHFCAPCTRSMSGEVQAPAGWVHDYVSTACAHAAHEGREELHAWCRISCKYALGEPELCRCPCHSEGAPVVMPVSWVDQARDVARTLFWAIGERDLPAIDRDLAERIAADPDLFWLRQETPGEGR